MKHLLLALAMIAASANAYQDYHNPLPMAQNECFEAGRVPLLLTAKLDKHSYQVHTLDGFGPMMLKTKRAEFNSSNRIVNGITIKYMGKKEVVMTNGFTDFVNTFEECKVIVQAAKKGRVIYEQASSIPQENGYRGITVSAESSEK